MKKSMFPMIAVIALAGLTVLAQQNNGGRGGGRGPGGGGRGGAAGGPGGGAGGGAFNRPMMGPGGEMGAGMMGGNWMEGRIMQPDFMEKVGISQEQVDKLKEALKELDASSQKINEEIMTLSRQQGELARKVLIETGASPEELMQLVEKIGKLRTDQAKLRTQRIIVIRDKFTPEQRTKIGTVLQEEQQQARQQRMQQRQQNAGGAGAGGDAPPPPRPAAPQGW